MSNAANAPRKRVPIFALILLAAALAIPAMPVQAHEEDVSAIEAFLHGLVHDGAITEVQHREGANGYADGV